MNCPTYLGEEVYYGDLYDRQTVGECRDIEKRFAEAAVGTSAEQAWQTLLTDTFTNSWRFLAPFSPKISRFPKESSWRKGWDSDDFWNFFQLPLLRDHHLTTRDEQPHN